MVVVVELVAAELERVHERIAGRFVRSEPCARAREGVEEPVLSRALDYWRSVDKDTGDKIADKVQG